MSLREKNHATKPFVISTNPPTMVPPVTGVPVNQIVTATFNEPMNPASITAPGTFTLTGPGLAPVLGAVTYAAISNTATFTPNANLANNTLYTATITTAAAD